MKNNKKMERKKIISLFISLGSYQSFVDKILFLANKRVSSYICVANVHMCIEAYRNTSFATIVNNADIVTPDGKPLVLSLKWLYGIQQDKVSGPDLMPVLLKEASEKSMKVFFYGSTDEVLKKLVDYCHIHFPKLTISGVLSPPFRQLSENELSEHIDIINNSDTNIVFVSLGCPKQEKWMASAKGKVHAVMLGVGGAFPMVLGIEKRAPKWMQEYALEWFYRLCQEPKRLWKRYTVTNSLFIFYLLKTLINRLFSI